MIKTKKKGSRLELKTKSILEKEGYLVTKSGGSLGLFDLVAMKKFAHKIRFIHELGLPTLTPNWRLIQVKANYCSVKERKEIKNLIVPIYTQKEIWVWKDRKKDPDIEIYG